MTEQWKPIGDKWPQPAMVWVQGLNLRTNTSYLVDSNTPLNGLSLPYAFLHPMPPSITPEQQAVLDAATRQNTAAHSRLHSHNEYLRACTATEVAVDDMLAVQQPPDPVKELLKAARALIDLHERNTCQHETTHRGGILWTICDDCGRKWADDEGGFKPYSEPAEIVNARAAIAAMEAKS